MIAVLGTTGSGKPEGEIISYHRDGHWDISYWDTKHTGHWDTIGYHPDGKFSFQLRPLHSQGRRCQRRRRVLELTRAWRNSSR